MPECDLQNQTLGLRTCTALPPVILDLMSLPHSGVPDIPGTLQREPAVGHLKQYVADLLQMRNYRYGNQRIESLVSFARTKPDLFSLDSQELNLSALPVNIFKN